MKEIACSSVDDFLSQVRTAAGGSDSTPSMEYNGKLNRMEIRFADCFFSIGMNHIRFYTERVGEAKCRDELRKAMGGSTQAISEVRE